MPATYASSAILGYGTTFGYAATQAGPFTLFAEIKSAPPPSPEANFTEVTHMLSPNKTIERIATLTDPGTMDVDCNYTTAGYTYALANVGVAQYFQVTLPDNAKFTFKGAIASISAEDPVDDAITFTMSFQLLGAITQS